MDRPIIWRLFEEITIDHRAERPVYLQLSDAILTLVKNGKLAAGEKLPGSRDVAGILHINRITVNKAFEELAMQGWLESAVGKGTFVSSHITDHEPKKLGKRLSANAYKRAGFHITSVNYLSAIPDITIPELHLDDGYPDPRLAPLKELYRAYRNQLTRSGLYRKFGSYGNPAGSTYYRQSMSDYLNTSRGLKTTARNILSVRGTLMGINLVCNALIAPGDVVISGIPGWRRVEHNFIHARAKHIGIPVDENGLVVEELKKICRKKKVRMVYVTPHHHYPTTVSLRIDRRLELLRLANEHGFIILEDDYDFDFHYRHRPLLPLASADENGMVIYCGSFSKSFSPAFRMGYLVAAENLIEHLAKVRVLQDRQGDHILDNAIADIINDGTIQRYLRKTLQVYEQRRDLFCSLLQQELQDRVQFNIPEGGMSVWTVMNRSINLDELVKKAYQKGLLLSDGDINKYPNLDNNAIRLGFASSTSEELIRSMEILKGLTGK
ncbi:PLP-dependent aminotransferase family protein [Chitinophaga sp.]|uniref:aminotransferase-like domain-containing protein n=1 Tax=Chitinophaga sp. TaxID=1869181 RepID=UPI002B96F3A1|nr:PLP-dependent aminotransferase family protein [Chitinophaga sp.]HWV68897.1 PLP-dependent aminotransferase family protein [Chitinophaga sp.]